MIDFSQPYTHGKEYNEGYNAGIDDFLKLAKNIKAQEGALSDADLYFIVEQLSKN